MCLQKVRVRDYGSYRSPRFSYYNCGHCAACRQQNANTKVPKISSHEPPDSIRYFVTLTYDNQHVPVCSKRQFKALYEDSKKLGSGLVLPVYRGINSHNSIDLVDLEDFDDPNSIDKLRGVVLHRDKLHPENNISHDDLFSIAYSADIRNFLKRLRISLFRKYEKNVPISYFYAPEYGPDSMRFHAHFIMWFPNWMACDDVKSFIVKAWPFADRDRTEKGVELAVAPAHYVASYVNCDASIPKILTDWFPLRQSHSLSFGFSKGVFTLAEILKSFDRGDYGYDVQTVAGNGQVENHHFLYSKSVISRYFPKFKGIARLSDDQIVNVLKDPSKYLRFAEKTYGFINEEGKFYTRDCRVLDYTSDVGIDYYDITLIDKKGQTISYNEKELQYTVNRINKCYRYFEQLGYSRTDFAHTVKDFIFGRQRFLYSDACQSSEYTGFNQLYLFDNIRETYIESLPTLEDFVKHSSPEDLDPSLNPFNQQIHNKYFDMYKSNIKHRKIMNL